MQHDVETLAPLVRHGPPLSTESVRFILQEHSRLLQERNELDTLVRRLLPSWAECRTVLNELSATLEPPP